MTEEQQWRLISAARKDAAYQKLLQACRELEPEYLRIRDSLSSSDQEWLEKYISTCEDLDFQKILLAYNMGTQDGARCRCAQFRDD